jgi:PAS domain S-box-containing protein
MTSFFLLIADVWVLSGLILLLHHRSPRLGFAPLMLTIGALVVLVQGQFGIYVEPVPGFLMFISSNGLVPVVLMTVLVIYVADGAVPARMIIYGVLGISLLVLGIQFVYRLHLELPGGGSFSGLTIDQLIPRINPRVTMASLLAFAADMFVIAVFYQGVKNNAPWLPEWAVVGLSLLASLWTDAILFRLVADLGTEDFLTLLPGDVVGKTISGLILWPLLAFYMVRVAPYMPNHLGASNRPTLDVFSGSFDEIKLALTRTEAALKESERQRRREETYFREISDHVNEALWLVAPGQHNAFYVNPAYEQIWGRSAESIYANPNSFVEAIHPDDRERIVAGLSAQVYPNYDVEYRIVRPDGSVRWVRDRAFPIRNESGDVYRVAGITEDITERKRIEEQQLALAVEREKVKLLRDFIGEFTHDLKSPLTSINLKVHHLAVTEDAEKRRALLDEATSITASMSRMIDDLLTLARLENIGEMVSATFEINDTVRHLCRTMHSLFDEKKIELVLELDTTNLNTRGAKENFSRACSNLLANAAHYTPAGGVVRVLTCMNEGEIVVKISDTGIGVSPEDQPRIFERFFRAANARAADPNGTGLGLAIVKKIVEQHGGRIEVESMLGMGTTFAIYLPCDDSDSE